MSDNQNNRVTLTLVAIDIAKKHHDALIQFPNGKTLQIKLDNSLSAYQRLWDASHIFPSTYKKLNSQCRVCRIKL